jgi:hypothetical protein
VGLWLIASTGATLGLSAAGIDDGTTLIISSVGAIDGEVLGI